MNVYELTARHVDTCMSSYLQDGHTREGELLLNAIPSGQTPEEAVQELLDSEQTWDKVPAVISEDEDWIKRVLLEAAKEIDWRPFDENGNRVESVPEDDTDICYEGSYVYVVLQWEVIEEWDLACAYRLEVLHDVDFNVLLWETGKQDHRGAAQFAYRFDRQEKGKEREVLFHGRELHVHWDGEKETLPQVCSDLLCFLTTLPDEDSSRHYNERQIEWVRSYESENVRLWSIEAGDSGELDPWQDTENFTPDHLANDLYLHQIEVFKASPMGQQLKGVVPCESADFFSKTAEQEATALFERWQ